MTLSSGLCSDSSLGEDLCTIGLGWSGKCNRTGERDALLGLTGCIVGLVYNVIYLDDIVTKLSDERWHRLQWVPKSLLQEVSPRPKECNAVQASMSAMVSATNRHCNLLSKLPAEIRNEVYRFVLLSQVPEKMESSGLAPVLMPGSRTAHIKSSKQRQDHQPNQR